VTTRQRSSFTRVILGTLLVLAGLAAALVTVLARRDNNSTVAGIAAIVSLLIALLLTIFIVPPLARSARVEVANLDFPFEPTSGGGVFLVIIIVVGFAAWNTGNNLLFLVFSLLCSTLFVGWIAARTSLRDLTVSARFPDHIFAAEPAPVIVTLRNTKRLLPSFSIFVEARGPSSETEREPPSRRR
jgi:UDP-N-acetylmuramyl pentapeptide phosphotransferase/UDP-N-acetylglucosamine-1-phosphate transferase